MRRAGTVPALAAAFALAALWLPAAAAAQTPLQARLTLPAVNGYRVAVVGAGDLAAVSVVRKQGTLRAARTDYVARATVTTGRLQASFGSFGQVAMRFHPSPGGTWSRSGHGCNGATVLTTRTGVFVGELRFRGEDGYISLDVRRAKGEVSRPAPACKHKTGRRLRSRGLIRPSSESDSGPEVPFLAAGWKDALDTVDFRALALHGHAAFIASTVHGGGRISIFRAAVALAKSPRSAFTLDNALTSARVSPPPPFSGSGTYAAAADGTRTWQGPLAVDFPGARHFPLTGSPLEAVVGRIPLFEALSLLRTAKRSDAAFLPGREHPLPLAALAVRPALNAG